MSKISDLTPDAQNAKAHNPRNVGMIVNALHEVGAARSIVIDEDGNILAGNATIEAAAEAGIENLQIVEADGETIVAVRRTGLTDAQKTRLKYFDNRTAELADWNPDVILADLEAGVDLGDIFTDIELEDFGWEPDKAEDPGADMDKADELQEKWGVKRGDLFVIPSQSVEGKSHRVMCGDSTSAEDVDTSWVLITDPPYGINRDPSWLDGVGTHRQALSSRDVLSGDDGSLDLSFLFNFDRRMIWGFPYIYDPQATGWIVWDKQPGVESRAIVAPIEMASTTMRKGFDMVRCMWGGYYRDAGETREPHPTQKPVGVIAPFVESWTKQGETVYDPFLGSGTTCVAAENLGRVCFGSEICEKYVSVSLERLQGMGLSPELVSDG